MQQNQKSTIKEKVMNYNELRKINVNEFTERKGQLTYLSWTYGVDILLQHDPMATWEWGDIVYFNESAMVSCSVTAFGKTMKMQLPVMDNRNQAIKNPDARKISDSQMRCLAKCIATFGIGLYIYAGSDLPSEAIDEEPIDLKELTQYWINIINLSETIDELKEKYAQAYKALAKDKSAVAKISAAKDAQKAELGA
jgi:hypothetical protein